MPMGNAGFAHSARDGLDPDENESTRNYQIGKRKRFYVDKR